MTKTSDRWGRWLSLKQAAEYSGIGRKRLILLAKQGHIKGYQDPDTRRHDWIFDRLSIDAYRERQIPATKTPKQKALDILKTISV